MYRLTERRFTKAKPILERYRAQLHTHGDIVASQLEHDLRECWNVGYRPLKYLMIDLSKQTRYRHLAASYMESGCPGVVSEFKPVLAGMYGIASYDHSPDRDRKREAFWKRLKAKRK